MMSAHDAALSVITEYDRRCKLPTSGLALMFEALDRAEVHQAKGMPFDAAIREEFNEPLASKEHGYFICNPTVKRAQPDDRFLTKLPR